MSAELIPIGPSAAPAVVLVPELGIAGRQLRRHAEAWVAAGRRVAIVDLFGGGRIPYDFAPVIRDELPEAVRSAGRGTILAGIGLGGHLALFAAVAMGDEAPPVATIATGIVEEAPEPSRAGLLGMLRSLGDAFGGLVGGRAGRPLASDGLAEPARLAELVAPVLAVAIEGDRTIRPDAVDRLADRLGGPVERADVATGVRGDVHGRWFVSGGPEVVAAVQSWSGRASRSPGASR